MVGRVLLLLMALLGLASSLYSFGDVVTVARNPSMSVAEAMAANLNLLLSVLLLTVCIAAVFALEHLRAVRLRADKADGQLAAICRLLQSAEDRARERSRVPPA